MCLRNFYLAAGEELEFTSSTLHATHVSGGVCAGAGMKVDASGPYTIDGVASVYSATVTSTWCDADMAAFFVDS